MGRVKPLGVSTTVLLLMLTAGAPAQSKSAMAEAFFRDGKRLMAEKKFAEACPKLEESQRLDPGVGTLLNLGACYEGWGKVASAWSRYSDAQTAAKREGQNDRAKLARERVRALEAQLPKLTIVVPPEANVPGLEVRLDGIVLTSAAYGAQVPVDPGTRRITATAPGKQPWTATVEIPGPRASVRASVGPLLNKGAAPAPARSPAPAPPPVPAQTQAAPVATSAPSAPAAAAPAPAPAAASASPSTPDQPRKSSRRTLGFLLGGLGLASAGAGTVFYVLARSDAEDSKKLCTVGPAGNLCATPAEYSEHSTLDESARQKATISYVGFGFGAAALVAGTVLVLTAPRDTTQKTASARLLPVVHFRELGLHLEGSW